MSSTDPLRWHYISVVAKALQHHLPVPTGELGDPVLCLCDGTLTFVGPVHHRQHVASIVYDAIYKKIFGCGTCGGSGRKTYKSQPEPVSYIQDQIDKAPCPDCDGTGIDKSIGWFADGPRRAERLPDNVAMGAFILTPEDR